MLITIQENTKWKERLREAIDRAKKMSIPVLFSEVKKMNRVDALSLFAASKEQYVGERFFWKNDAEQMTIVGLGICGKVETDQATDRFSYVEKEWQKLKQSIVMINRYDESGVGPLLFGGFSFDPKRKKTKLWSNYAHSTFRLPQFMYTEKNGQAYMTMNVICTEKDDETLIDKIEQKRSELFEQIDQPFTFYQNPLVSEVETNPEKWKRTVEEIVVELKEDELKKVVLARETRLTYKHPIQTERVLYNLLHQQQQCFIFAFESGRDCFIGATPERLIKKEDRNMMTACIAGSIKRGNTTEEDNMLGDMLLNDEKNLVEHQYVVDMIKEAVVQLCDEVELPHRPTLLKMRDIQHLHTPVSGKVKETTSLLLLVERLHPTPALGGTPKDEAVKKIREVEELDRGLYGSPLGWIDYNGNGDFAVSIRSGLIQENEISLFAGCGVVENSNVESEYEETKVKFRPMLSALGGY